MARHVDSLEQCPGVHLIQQIGCDVNPEDTSSHTNSIDACVNRPEILSATTSHTHRIRRRQHWRFYAVGSNVSCIVGASGCLLAARWLCGLSLDCSQSRKRPTPRPPSSVHLTSFFSFPHLKILSSHQTQNTDFIANRSTQGMSKLAGRRDFGRVSQH